MLYPQLTGRGNAGRVARWILGNIGDPFDHWQHGNGVTSAGAGITLAIGDTTVTLENKWWGVRGSLVRGTGYDSLLRVWEARPLWAPPWLRRSFSVRWAAQLTLRLAGAQNPFWWDEHNATESLRTDTVHMIG